MIGESEASLCVLVGPDGSGKTTVLERIRRSEPAWKCISASPVDLYPLPGLEFMNYALRRHPREYVGSMPSMTRAAFFVLTLAVQYEYHIRPALARGRTVVCDSYYYRFLAKERLLNPAGADLLEHFAARLPHADLVVRLEVPLDVALRRKSRVSEFERFDDGSTRSFHRLQRAVEADVRRMTEMRPTLEVDGTLAESEVERRVIGGIRDAESAAIGQA